MNYLFSFNSLMRKFFPAIVKETGPVNEIEMIELSSWEWFLILSIVIIIIWLLILFQTRLTQADNFGIQSHEGQEFVSEHHSGGDFSGNSSSIHEE